MKAWKNALRVKIDEIDGLGVDMHLLSVLDGSRANVLPVVMMSILI